MIDVQQLLIDVSNELTSLDTDLDIIGDVDITGNTNYNDIDITGNTSYTDVA